MKLGIIANTGKTQISQLLESFLVWLDQQEIPYLVAQEVEPLIKRQAVHYAPANELGSQTDFVLSFGGDGTFLQTARTVAASGKPIVGVNLGGFGYLAEIGVESLTMRIHDLTAGRFYIQERIMLGVAVVSTQDNYIALNDITIDKGGFARTIKLETSIDDEYLNTFTADGLIVSTPTGSTGYSLSAGGPILEPRLNGIIINPICPHTLANRPLVVCGDRMVRISTFSESGFFQLAADGQVVQELASGSEVEIRRSPFVTRIVHFEDSSFFKALRNKLQWRTRRE